jgi:hypothetical protein
VSIHQPPISWKIQSKYRFDGVTSVIGCTRLLAVSGILRTQLGRRGSGPGRRPAGASPCDLAEARRRHRPCPLCGRAWCSPCRAGQARAGRVLSSASSPGPLCGRDRCRPHRDAARRGDLLAHYSAGRPHAAGRGAGRHRGPEPCGTGDSESAAQPAVSGPVKVRGRATPLKLARQFTSEGSAGPQELPCQPCNPVETLARNCRQRCTCCYNRLLLL